MKIVQIVTRLNVGGISRYVLELCAGMARRGHEVWLVSGTPEPGEGDALAFHQGDLAGIRLESVPALRRSLRPGDDARALLRLSRILRSIEPDVVHTHMSKAGTLGRIVGARSRAPVRVHSLHGTVLDGHFPPAASRMIALWERAISSVTTRILVPSSSVADHLAERGVASGAKVVVVPYGFDLEAFAASSPKDGLATRERVGAGPGDPVVGSVSRLVPVKGVDVLIDAAAIVAGEESGVKFFVAGDGELRQELARKASRAASDAVHLLGFWPDLVGAYAAADVVVLASHSEGNPVTLIEAAASGRPVVATRVGGVPDVVIDGETGFLVPPADPKALAGAILALIRDADLRREMGDAARRRVLERFSIEASVDATLDVYERAVKARMSR